MTATDGHRAEARALVNDIEGHLLLSATREEGRRAAERFASDLWPAGSERELVCARFEAEYLALARESWQRTATRAEELRAEYEEAFRVLRRRLLARCAAGCAVFLAVALTAVLAVVRGAGG
ncbi:hypothetical protein [Streptomyces sp. NPDC005805]|uniref:hypothetical protein n=1 Tax=Streptomyces sp. NPDC005805 TaxID=3157068 RepID=UPI0033D40ED1